jgi:hypothetical protein
MMSQRVTWTGLPVTEPVTVINAFTVPLEPKRFLERRTDNAQAMAGQPGFARARICRSVAGDAGPRLVNTAERGSGNAPAQARSNPGWRTSMQRMLDDPDLHITPGAGAYQVAIDIHPGDTP